MELVTTLLVLILAGIALGTSPLVGFLGAIVLALEGYGTVAVLMLVAALFGTAISLANE